jgi:hypothetical protein
MSARSFFVRGSCLALVIACVSIPSARHADAATLETLLPHYRVSSTIPPNGDLNPYGVAFVPADFPSGGIISAGDVLVSNFNDINNCQGQGTTIIKFTPNNVAAPDSVAPGVAPGQMGNATAFFQSPKLVGLSTALGVLRGGFVIVGNVPSGPESNGPSGPVCSSVPSSGALQVIDRHGKSIATLTDPVGTVYGSPWDLTIANDTGSTAQLFVSNVLTGTVGRLDLAVSASGVSIVRSFVVAKGYQTGLSNSAFVLGPTGLAHDQAGDLFVASTADNKIFKVPDASRLLPPAATTGTPVVDDQRLRGPLGLVLSPVGTLLTANGDAVNDDPMHPSEIVEFTTKGAFIRESNIESMQGGAFGLATATSPGFPIVFSFAAVDDISNSVLVRTVPVP